MTITTLLYQIKEKASIVHTFQIYNHIAVQLQYFGS